jgi:hypothetical protein
MMSTVYLERKDPTVDRLITLAFPDFSGKRISCEVSDKIHFHSTNWDSGYKRTYRIVRLADMAVLEIADAPFLQDSKLHQGSYEIPDGFLVVVLVDSACKQSIQIVAPAGVINAALPAPESLTEDETTVLIATRSLKSSYGGISNYRFHEASQKRGITLDRWNAAKNALISRGLLNKAGALTTKGKNAAGGGIL